jgi:hypothetical protein
MQVESPKDLIDAYAIQVSWLERRLTQLKLLGFETSPISGTVQAELDWAKNALDLVRKVVAEPKGYLVQVLRSKIYGLRDKVGRVTYASADRNYATVEFEGGVFSHNLSLSNLLVIDMPVPSVRIPSPGMVVKFKGDSQEYVSVLWNSENVFVEPKISVDSGADTWTRDVKRVWKDRFAIETINGVVPV